MTLPVLLAHVAARWAATRTPTCGWVPDESETEMTERTYTLEDMARAWDEAREHGYRDAQEYRSSGGWDGCGPDAHDCDCPNPYEQEEA